MREATRLRVGGSSNEGNELPLIREGQAPVSQCSGEAYIRGQLAEHSHFVGWV